MNQTQDPNKSRKTLITVSIVFTWIGVVVTSIYRYIAIKNGLAMAQIPRDVPREIIKSIMFGFYFVWGLFTIGRIVFASFSVKMINGGGKIACGVITLLFISLVAGILILCIPKEVDEIHYIDSFVRPRLTDEERDERINVNKNLMDRGLISEEEYQRRVYEIYGQSLNVPKGIDKEKDA